MTPSSQGASAVETSPQAASIALENEVRHHRATDAALQAALQAALPAHVPLSVAAVRAATRWQRVIKPEVPKNAQEIVLDPREFDHPVKVKIVVVIVLAGVGGQLLERLVFPMAHLTRP